MKYYLFIDNFRGFANTSIPITDVNFLVGENSTGKTSVMGLLKVFSGPRFLMQQQQELGDEHVSFGHFSDMVSAHSEDRTYFSVGLVWETTEKEATAAGWLCTFQEDQGLPRISRFTLYRGLESMSLRFAGNNLFFKTDTHASQLTAQEVIAQLLPEWVRTHRDNSPGYEKLDVAGFPGRLPILIALALAGNGKLTEGKRRKNLDIALQLQEIGFASGIAWVAPIRTKPRRTYDELTTDFSPEGAHTPYLIRKTLRSRKEAEKFRAFIQRVGQSSGLFEDVQIKNFGKDVTAPFELDIVLDGRALNLSTVGYGVSQSLPVFVELIARAPGTWFAIQQPEVHLHPRAQAALGDVFFEMATAEHKRFLVETHSDFMIDRFRMKYGDKKGAKPSSQILFFERKQKHNVVTPVLINSSGELPAEQPKAYRDFFIREELRLLGIE